MQNLINNTKLLFVFVTPLTAQSVPKTWKQVLTARAFFHTTICDIAKCG